MRLTLRHVESVRGAIDGIDARVRDAVLDVLAHVDIENEDALREALRRDVAPVAKMGADMADELAMSVYNALREASIGETMDTVASSSWDGGKFDAAVNTAVKRSREGATLEQIAAVVISRASYDMRRSYGNTLISNAANDPSKPRFARVPSHTASYADGCPFCRMLASRGFVYRSRKTAGEFDHYHADCSCQVVCSWDETPEVEGYDPEAYYDEYKAERQEAISQKRDDGGYTAVDARDISKAARDMGLDGRN